MKNSLYWSWLFVLTLLMTGCAEPESDTPGGNGDSQPTESGEANNATDSGDPDTPVESKGTIGYTTMDLTNPFFKIISENMKEEAAKHGYDVVTVSGDKVTNQSNQIDDFIVQGVAAIVITPCDPKSIGQAIRKANDAGIPVFTNDTSYDGDEGKVECHVATDNLQGGRLAGEAMVKLLGDSGGNVLIVHKPDASSCLKRVQGFQEVVDAHNAKDGAAQIKVVATLNGDGRREIGYAVTKDAIVQHGDLSAIFAINDPSALGAYTALEEANKTEQVTIIAFDGEKAGKQAILEGKIHCDPIQFPDQIGRITVQQIIKYFDGEDLEKQILIPSALYYKEDAEADPALKEQ